MILVLVAAAPSGLVLVMGVGGDIARKIYLVLISLSWFFFMLRAWLRIRRRDLKGHQADILQSYALAFGAIILQLWMFLIGR